MKVVKICIWVCIILFLEPYASYGQVCNIPFNIRFENKKTTSIQVSWSDINNMPEGWEIEIVKRGDTQKGIPSLPRLITKSATIQNLLPSTSYDLYIRTVCLTGFSKWNVAIPFNTLIQVPTACQINIPLKDNGTEILELDIPYLQGLNNPILGVNIFLQSVDLMMEHGWPADMKVILESPQGQQLVLSNHNGTVTRNFGLLRDEMCEQFTSFSLDACRILKDSKPPFVGLFHPDGDVYNWKPDTLRKGTWKLITFDRAVKDAGTLKYLNINFSDQVCIIPDNFTIQNVDINQITVAWKYKSPCNTVSLHVFESGIPIDTFFVPCNEEQFTIKKLKPNTEYAFSITSLCTHSSSSSDGCLIYASTSCEPVSIAENFDSYPPCEESCSARCTETGALWHNASRNGGQDWLIKEGKTDTEFTGPDGDINGTGSYLYLENNPQLCGENNEAILQSTCIDIESNPSGCDMSFNYHMYGSDIKSLKLEISIDGGAAWNTLFLVEGNHGEKWLKHTLSLEAYQDQMGIFRFVGISGEGPLADIAIDQIEFYKSLPANGLNKYYYDADGDGYGSDEETIKICALEPPSGYVVQGGDCDDDNPNIHPGAHEIQCNAIDENCNGNDDDQPEVNPLVAHTNIFPSSCNGSEDGSIQLEISGGNPPYEVKWNNSMTGASIFGLSSGVYYATITDIGGCIFKTPFYSIESTTNLNIIAKSIHPASCSGKSDGKIEISHTVEYPPYTYLWSTGDTTKDIDNIMEGNYSVTVTDSKNCFAVLQDIKLNSKPSVLAGVQAKSDPTCHGKNDGYLEVFAINGSPPYNYNWSIGEITNRITAISAGDYTCTITDNNACRFILKTELKDPPELKIQVVSTEDVRCYGETNGSIKTNVTGGKPGYTYLWNTYAYTNDDIFNIAAGLYVLTVTDANGCRMVTSPISIMQPRPLEVMIDNIRPATCISGEDGQIRLLTTGGNGDFFFVWNVDGGSGVLLDSIPKGNYNVTVYDQLGCKSGIPNINVPYINTPVDIQLKLIRDNICYKESTAVIEVLIDNGTPTYDYNWSHGKQYFEVSGKDTIDQLSAGVYTLTITDSNGCVGISNTIKIAEKPEFSYRVTSIGDNVCKKDSIGQIVINIQGGQDPMKVLWNGGLYSGREISGLPNGVYYGIITDNHNCRLIIDTIPLQSQSDMMLSADIKHDTGSRGEGSIYVNVMGGLPPYLYLWSTGLTGKRYLDNLNAGIYEVTITDALGCREKASFVVENLSATYVYVDEKTLIYPNPVTDMVYIQSKEIFDRYNVLDIRGKLLDHQTFRSEDELKTLDFSGYPSGVYIVLLYNGEKARRFKVVKI